MLKLILNIIFITGLSFCQIQYGGSPKFFNQRTSLDINVIEVDCTIYETPKHPMHPHLFYQLSCVNGFNYQNGDTYITMGKRKKGSEADRAVGQSEIIDGTGFWINYIGINCTYAIEYVDNIVFAPGKCKGSK